MNKGILKLSVVFFAGLMAFSTAVFATGKQQTDLYVTAGFPYENLVQRFDTVKIHYAETEDNALRCRVELISETQSTTALSQTINEKQFAETPLKSCISRKEAIAALATTY